MYRRGEWHSNHFKTHWSLYVPPELTLKNSAFCPQSVFVCILRISGEKNLAIIFLYDINFILFVTEADYVYCAVRTESVNVGLCLAVLRRLVAGLSP